ncbi:MAG: vWA domain-containing protein [candidate division WOR-3 bacterium]
MSRIVILDDSYSMAYGNNFSQAKLQVTKLFSDLSHNSEVAVITSTGNVVTNFITKKALLEKMVDTLSVSYHANTIEEAFQRAIDLLSKASFAQKEIFIITDLQKRAIEPILPLLASKQFSNEQTKINCWIIDVGSQSPINAGISEIFLNPNFPTPDLPVRVNVRLKNYSDKIINLVLQCYIEFTDFDSTLSLMKDMKSKGVGDEITEDKNFRTEVSLKPNEDKTITFDTEIKKSGRYQIRATISQDSLPVDNQYYYTFEIPQKIPILLIYKNRLDINYVEKALSQSNFEITELDVKSLPKHNLNRYHAIGIFSPSQLSYADWERLGYFVQQGKGLFIALDDNIKEPKWYQALNLGVDLGGLGVTSILGQSGFITIGKIDYSHPIMEIFREVDLGLAKFFRFWELSDATDKSNFEIRQKQTLAYFSTGKPFLLEDPNQRIIIALSSFDTQSTDLMFKTTFLPLVHRIFTYLALSNIPERYRVGDVVRMRIDKSAQSPTIKIKTPVVKNYEIIPKEKDYAGVSPILKLSDDHQFIEFANTSLPGFYQIQDHFFCVNVEPSEGNLLKVPEASLKNQGISVVKDVTAQFTDLSRPSIYLALAFLILEMVILCI